MGQGSDTTGFQYAVCRFRNANCRPFSLATHKRKIMTQTISIARGTVSSAADGTTRSTLFTNSASVIATRVIVNQVAWTTSNSISGGPYKAALIHYNAAGQYSVLGLQTHAYPYSCGFQFNIGTTPEAYFASSTNSYFGVQKIFQNGAGQIGTDINAIDCPVISQNVPNNTNFCASQFWIGPSDVISFAVYSPQGGSATVGYSFTLISES